MDLIDLGLLLLDLGLHLHSHVRASSKLSLQHLNVTLLTFSYQALTVVFAMERADLFVVNANLSQTACLVFFGHLLEELFLPRWRAVCLILRRHIKIRY